MSGTSKNPRVFVDTNVFFSGFYSPDNAPGVILRMMLDNRITLVISKQILNEIVRTFQTKLPRALPALRRFLENAPLKVIEDPFPEKIVRWREHLQEADASIFTAAINADADFFITGDNHFLRNEKLKAKSGITVISPANFIKQFHA